MSIQLYIIVFWKGIILEYREVLLGIFQILNSRIKPNQFYLISDPLH